MAATPAASSAGSTFGLGAGDVGRRARALARRRVGPWQPVAADQSCHRRARRPAASGRGSRRRTEPMATTTRRARLADVDLPDFGMPGPRAGDPARRLRRAAGAAARARWSARGYDRLVVYADREHSANLAWLTGFDPRFEEAIVGRRPGRRARDPRRQRVLRHGRRRAAADAPRAVPGPQPARPAARPVAAAGRRSSPTRASGRVAASGSSAGRRTPSRAAMDAPAFLVDELRRLAGSGRPGRERHRPADRRGRRPAGDERGRAAGRARVRRLPDVQRASAAC